MNEELNQQQADEMAVEPATDDNEAVIYFENGKSATPEAEDHREDSAEKQQAPSDMQRAMAELVSDDADRIDWSLAGMLQGEMLKYKGLRKQVPFIITIIAMLFIYITNIYYVQREIIEIERLREKCVELNYRSTARSSQLMQRSRESKVAEYLRHTADSTLTISKRPPYVIHR